MLSLADLALLMLCVTFFAWLWRGHGIREQALKLARRHCEKLDIELLDQNVALRGLRLRRDQRGNLRLAREYGFEFTVTGDQRLAGCITLFGRQLGKIELDPHPFTPRDEEQVLAPSAQVVRLADWRREHPQTSSKPH
jgi:hypothetical protein